jgi:drug/metabolite transporter (DMT)-like permease
MAVHRPEPRDDADPPEDAMPVEASGPDVDATIPGWSRASLFGEDTETLFTKDPSDRPGFHVRLFGSHEFFRLWLVQVVSATGDWLGFSAIILLAATIGGGAGAGAISLVMAARIVPGFFFGPLAGVLVDRWDRKKVMVSCDIGRAIVLAMLGTVLLVTHGETGVLQISLEALLWGLSSALALAFYTVQPVALLKRHDSAVVVGWGMLIGGLAFVGWSQPWHVVGTWDSGTYGAVLFIVVLGTLVPFYCYLLAVKTIGPQRSSLLACAEPLSAALVSVWWLNVAFGWLDVVGSLCIVLTIYLLAGEKQWGSDPH